MKSVIYFLTPGLTGGGWNVIKNFIKTLIKYQNQIKINIISAGVVEKDDFILKEKKIKIFKLPWLSYDNYVNFLEKNLLLNILFNLPYLGMCFIKLIFNIKNIKVVICNGILSFIPAFFVKILKNDAKVFVWIHTDLRFSDRKIIKKIILNLSSKIDCFWVNSDDVKNDLIKTGISSSKIYKILNVVEEVENTEIKDERLRFLNNYKFKILFVGRFVEYKHITLYLKVAKNLASKDICFVFVGTGEFQKKVEKLSSSNSHIYYLGKLPNHETRKLYSKFNITLCYADETYVSMTALESLYAGTPVLYPDISSAPSKYNKRIKIKNNILPEPIGFKIKASEEDFCKKILELYMLDFPSQEIRNECKNFVRQYHSSQNFIIVIEKFLKLKND